MLTGVGRGASTWRHPDALADASVNPDVYKGWARKAEEGKLDFLFIADSLYIEEKSTPHLLNRFEPLTLLGTLASVTERIGLVGTLSTTYSDPFTAARQFASLDLLSGGRAGWNVVTSTLEATALNYGNSLKTHPEHDERYRMAAGFLKVAKDMWDSPEERSGQVGRPVLFQAGASEAGRSFAASEADAVFSGMEHATLEEAVSFYRDVKARVAAAGRDPDGVLVFPMIAPIIGRTRGEAKLKYEEAANLVSLDEALLNLSRYFDYHDFTLYAPDEPFPELGDLGRNGFRGMTERIKRNAREQGQTLRQAALQLATPREAFVIGTAEDVADDMQERFEAGAADGFVLGPVLPRGLEEFVDAVVPELCRRGLFRDEYESGTLRGNLGLPAPSRPSAAGRSRT